MVLLFQGEDAVNKIRQVAGELSSDRYGGETISGTYGDLVCDVITPGKPVYFEPAVLVASTEEGAASAIRLWSKYYADSGVLTNVETYPEGVQPQVTLAMIKPDNFRFPMGRPGNVIDFFSQAGLSIIGIKVQRMSTAQAVEFYGPVLEVLRTKLGMQVSEMVRPAIEKTLGSALDEETARKVGDLLCPTYGEKQFENIVRFMSGRSQAECEPGELNKPGTEESLVLIYEGPDAIARIRKALGPTDPSKAPPGSIRREFGSNVMVNAAHASDSEESVKREMEILIHKAPNDFKELCDRFY
ncbi:MAG: nucleoside-diphosphate kinase [Limisphaerales bacterium]